MRAIRTRARGSIASNRRTWCWRRTTPAPSRGWSCGCPISTGRMRSRVRGPRCFGGAATINTLDFITRIYRAVGRAPKYLTVGAGMLKFMGWFNPTLREVVEMLYLQETPVILDDRKLMAKLPVHKTPYDDGIRQTLEWMRGE